jgi:hypothetical protein
LACPKLATNRKKLLDAKTEFTILSWVKPGNLTANRIGLVGQNDSPEFGLSNPKTIMLWTPCNSVDTAFDFPAGEWHHVAAVASGSFVKLYLDGAMKAEKKADCKDHGTSNFNVNIGGCGIWDAANNWFTGAMDEVAIFHSVLDDAAINKIMKSGFVAMTTAVDPRNRLALTWAKIRQEQ